MALPSMVQSNWISMAHTTPDASATTGGTDDTPDALARADGQVVDLVFVDHGARRSPAFPRRTRKPMTGVFGGVGPQPGPHLGVGIVRVLRGGKPAVGGAGQPNGLAHQPLRLAQRVFEHVHGVALGSWAQRVSARAAPCAPWRLRCPSRRSCAASWRASPATPATAAISLRSCPRQPAHRRCAVCARFPSRNSASDQPCVSSSLPARHRATGL